jgi:hypothetical protein
MEEFLNLCKEFAHGRLTASGRANDRPAYLFSAHLVATSGGTATASIYNSQGAFGDPEADLSAPASGVDQRVFVPPLYFDKGIYVNFGNNVTSVLLQYRQIGDMQKLVETRSLKSYIPSWLGGPKKEVKNT